MEQLLLFGLVLQVDDSDILEPVTPGVEVSHWHAEIDKDNGVVSLRAWLHVDGNFTLQLNLDILVQEIADEVWTVRDGEQPQSDPRAIFRFQRGRIDYPGSYDPGDSPPVQFQVGPFFEELASFEGVPIQGNEGLRLNFLSANFLNRDLLPVVLTNGETGVHINLRAIALEIAPGFFKCTTNANLLVPDDDLLANLFERNWNSRKKIVPLRDGADEIEIEFSPEHPNQGFPLSIDVLDRSVPLGEQNPVVPAQSLFGGQLRFVFQDTGELRIVDAQYGPGDNGTSTLKTHFLAHEGGEGSNWVVTERLPLHIRTGFEERPSTFLLAPFEAGVKVQSDGHLASLHGPIASAEFHLSGEIELRCQHREPQHNPGQEISVEIASECTVPFFLEKHSAHVVHSKPGQTHRTFPSVGVQNDVVKMNFLGGTLGVPITPDFQLKHYPNLIQEAHTQLDEIAQLSLQPSLFQNSIHETQLVETSPDALPEELKVVSLFGGDQPESFEAREFTERALSSGTALRLDSHGIRRSYGDIVVQHAITPMDTLDYALLFLEDQPFGGSEFNFRLDKQVEVSLRGAPVGVGTNANTLVGILKLTSAYDLGQILERESDRISNTAGDWNWREFLDGTLVDSSIKHPGWLGMLLFNVPIDVEQFDVLRSMTPNDLHLSYLALTPQKGNEEFSASARVRRVVGDANLPDSDEADEMRFRLGLLDMIWKDSSLVNFRTEAFLRVSSIFSEPNTDEPEIRVVGSYDKERKQFRFLGELPFEFPVFRKDENFGPIKQVYVRSAEIMSSSRGARLNLDGRIELQPFTMDGARWFEGASGLAIRFKNLGLWIPPADGLDWRWLQVDYPSLKLDLDGPQFRLLDILDLKITGFGVDWPNLPDAPKVPWGELAPISQGGNFSFELPVLSTGLRLDLMQLPELVARSLERLRFDFTVGFNADPFDGSRMKVALSAVDFEGLNLELLRFLAVKARSIAMSAYEIDIGNGPEFAPRFDFEEVSVEVLGKKLISKLDLIVYSLPDGRTCFLSRVIEPEEIGLIKVEWVLIGQNMKVPEQLAEDLLAIRPATDNDDFRVSINNFWDNGGNNNGFLPISRDDPRIHGEWIFGAGFSVAKGLFKGKFLFQDNRYYGLTLDGTLFKDWFGWDFAISVLYIVGERPEKDRFVVSLRVPSVTLPAFHLFGGVIRVDVDMRGRFLLDVGFPWMRKNGSREWDRAFGAIVTPFQGTGGSYFANGLARTELPDDVMSLGGGLAIQFGFGGAFGGSVFRVWATAGIYFVVEGQFYLQESKRKLIGARLSGAVGILVRAGGELNWWIISVRVEIVVSAEAQLVILWAWKPADGPPLAISDASEEGNRNPVARYERSDPIEARVSFVLYARARAKACIGGGWFKVCKGISVTVPLRYDCRFNLA